jgi:hypothetical protein
MRAMEWEPPGAGRCADPLPTGERAEGLLLALGVLWLTFAAVSILLSS